MESKSTVFLPGEPVYEDGQSCTRCCISPTSLPAASKKHVFENIRHVPAIDDVVIARIVRISCRLAAAEIIGLTKNQAIFKVPGGFKGIVRQSDIYESDVLEIPRVEQCFRPGDIVRAKILGNGDASTGFLLATGSSDLGVLLAKSNHTGQWMEAVSETSVKCPVSGLTEGRKCATI